MAFCFGLIEGGANDFVARGIAILPARVPLKSAGMVPEL